MTREYGQGLARVLALRGLDLDVYPGQLTLLVGPSGCGKTTLLSIISAILSPTDGSVSVFGIELPELSADQKVTFRRDKVGFVFQQYNLLPALTAAENVAVPLVIAGTPRGRALAKANDLLGTLGMGHRAGAVPAQLSGGEQQRVAIGRALVHEPRLLVCDEPTSALDEKTGHAIMELLTRFAVNPQRAVIVVTHDNRVFEFGDRIAYMNDGRVVNIEALAAAADPAGGQDVQRGEGAS
ncbi:MAG: ABC transporter ATP-binding protein [Phycisphaerae bacterium]|nr:ABC transporter ATP-binding protein [Phycisphaerae bacterium]